MLVTERRCTHNNLVVEAAAAAAAVDVHSLIVSLLETKIRRCRNANGDGSVVIQGDGSVSFRVVIQGDGSVSSRVLTFWDFQHFTHPWVFLQALTSPADPARMMARQYTHMCTRLCLFLIPLPPMAGQHLRAPSQSCHSFSSSVYVHALLQFSIVYTSRCMQLCSDPCSKLENVCH